MVKLAYIVLLKVAVSKNLSGLLSEDLLLFESGQYIVGLKAMIQELVTGGVRIKGEAI